MYLQFDTHNPNESEVSRLLKLDASVTYLNSFGSGALETPNPCWGPGESQRRLRQVRPGRPGLGKERAQVFRHFTSPCPGTETWASKEFTQMAKVERDTMDTKFTKFESMDHDGSIKLTLCIVLPHPILVAVVFRMASIWTSRYVGESPTERVSYCTYLYIIKTSLKSLYRYPTSSPT